MSELVDVTYRGLKVATRAPATPVDAGCLFVEHETPLPVGAPVRLARAGETLDGRVVAVIEQEASCKSRPGMRIRWKDDAAAARPAAPAVVESVPEPISPDERKTDVMEVPALPPEEPRSRDTIIGMPAMSAADISTDDADASSPGDAGASDAGTSSSGRRRRRRKNGR